METATVDDGPPRKAYLSTAKLGVASADGVARVIRGNTVLATFNLNHLFNMNIDLFSSDPRIEYDTISGRWLVSFLILDTTDRMWLPIEGSWRLNERHYGALQGLNKAQTVAQHGEAQVKLWRRSYDIPPPPLQADDPRHPRFDPRYADVDPTWLPAAESLKDTLSRVLPYWESRIVPELRANKTVLIVAHGNSLRALVKMLDMMSEADIVEFNIPTGVPMLYELDEQLQPVSRRFLGDPKAIAAAQDAVKNQLRPSP